MSGMSINFDDKKINKGTFDKNKKLFNIHDLDVNKIKMPLNTSLDIMMMMLLDHYV